MTDRVANQRAFVNHLLDTMSFDDWKSYAQERLHQIFDEESDFDFNETMLDNNFDPREVTK
jgi:hypothetical protein